MPASFHDATPAECRCRYYIMKRCRPCLFSDVVTYRGETAFPLKRPVVTSCSPYTVTDTNTWDEHSICLYLAVLALPACQSPAYFPSFCISHATDSIDASVLLVMEFHTPAVFLIVAHLLYLHSVLLHASSCFYVHWIGLLLVWIGSEKRALGLVTSFR